MSENFENIKNTAKKMAKQAGKKIVKTIAPAILVICIIIVILSGGVYEITRQDAGYRSNDWTSIPYAASQYINNVTIDSTGQILTGITAKELWNKMIDNNSRVDEYLDGPEELLKLLNAEIITNYPDTRPNPDEEIDWKQINKDVNSNKTQGIVKFKRAQSDGTILTMSFVDSDTFYQWLEKYNTTGDEKIKKELLTHFTIEEETNIIDNGISLDYSSNDLITDISEQIIEATKVTPWPGKDLCQAWVRAVYRNAGLGDRPFASAAKAAEANIISTDKNNIPIGAAVYGTGSGKFGHVGIYIGNGKVMDSIGDGLNVIDLDDWIAWQERKGYLINGKTGWLGWGWQSGQPTQILSENENSEEEQEEEDVEQEENTEQLKYKVIVATWSKEEEEIETNDPDVQEVSNTSVSMNVQEINYQDMISKYSMPFDYLWALIVTGREKEFPLQLTDLVYDSEIEITVHDNLIETTDIDTYKYTKKTKVATHSIIVEVDYGDSENDFQTTYKYSQKGDEKELSDDFTTTHKVTRTDNNLNISLTKANVWIVDYEQDFEFINPVKAPGSESTPEELEKVDYPDEPNRTDNKDTAGIAENYRKNVLQDFESYLYKNAEVWKCTSDYYYSYTGQVVHQNTIETSKYNSSPASIKEKISKTADEPNFVNLFLSEDNYEFRNNILSAPDWLFDILKENKKTVEMVDLTKYLLHVATGDDFGVDNFDFSIFNATSFGTISSGSEGGISLTTTMFTKEVFIQALQAYYSKTNNQDFYNNFLQKADELYNASIANNVNPELVVITAKSEGNFKESGGSFNYWGLGVPNGASKGYSYTSLTSGIAGYASYINKYNSGSYASMIMKRYEERKAAGCDPLGYGLPGTLSGMQSIYSYLGKHEYGSSGKGGYYYMDPARAGVTKIYATHEEFLQKCKESGLAEHAEGTETTVWEQGQYTAWQVEQKLQTWDEIFGPYGSRTENSQENSIIDIAKTKLGAPYVYGAKGPNSFDCSGFVYWCYEQIGVSVPRSTDGYSEYAGTSTEISWDEAKPGDILIIFGSERGTSDGHAAIYLGNDSYIHAPRTGDVVKIVKSGAKSEFKHVFRFN